MIRKIINRISNIIWKFNRIRYMKKVKSSITIKEVPTIISCNCTGGVMYHDLGLKFNSPTINLYMECEHFIKFCENLPYYLNCEMMTYEGEIERNYPIAQLGDLILYLVHYKSFEEAKNKWDVRKKRVNMENIRVIGTNRDGCTNELKNRFEALPYKKVMFTHIYDKEHNSCFYIKGYENDKQVGTVVEPDGRISGKRKFDQFDWVDFLLN